MIMKKILEYCYYRIAKAYKKSGDDHYLDWGYWVLLASFAFITFGIVSLVSKAIQIKLNKSVVIIVCVLVGALNVFCSLFISDDRKYKNYKRLDRCYINERHRRIKGCLVLLYLIGTVIFSIVCAAWAGYGE